MSKIVFTPNASGTGNFTITSPNSNTNRQVDLPDAAGGIVIDSATQTLTNKTLTAPVLSGTATGTYTLGGTPTISSPTITGASMSSMASSVITSGTSVASTSGTSIDFTGIPSWVKRITVMLNGVSTNGTVATWLIQLGTGGTPETSGYTCCASFIAGASVSSTNTTAGFGISKNNSASDVLNGVFQFVNLTGNTWTMFGLFGNSNTAQNSLTSGSKTLAGVLNMVRITTNSTDTFDAGSINILYE